jgi:hypothetical protein
LGTPLPRKTYIFSQTSRRLVHALLGFATPFKHAVSYADQLAKPEAFAISFNFSRLRDCLRFWVVSPLGATFAAPVFFSFFITFPL